jgi:Quercetinase C-terminal cupin domain
MGPPGEGAWTSPRDARVFVTRLREGRLAYSFAPGRGGSLYVIDGVVSSPGDDLVAGDAIKIEGAEQLALTTADIAELILVDVPLDFDLVGVWANQ